MKTKVVLTVDTEPSIAGAFNAPDRDSPILHELVWGEVDGRSEALGFMIRTLERHGLVATFFVETAHTAYFPADTMGHYVEMLQQAAQDVQLHVHPSWLTFRDGKPDLANRVSDNCSELSEPVLTELLTRGCDQIESWTGARPTGMRTGNFATAMNVFRAMSAAGLRNSSNICLAAHLPPEAELAVAGGLHIFEGVRELPVTCFRDVGPVGRGRLRQMQITSLSAAEQIALLEKLNTADAPVAVIVTHPFEYLKKSDYRYHDLRPNRLVQGRFEKLCAYLASHADRFETVSLGDAATELTAPAVAAELVGDAVRSTVRAAQNFLNDRL